MTWSEVKREAQDRSGWRPSVLDDGHFVTKIVYVLSICLLVREMPTFPKIFWRKYAPVCFFTEMAITLAILECSLLHGWTYLEEYVRVNSDDLLVQLTSVPNLEWLVCHICCGKSECTEIFAQLLLKMLSFIFLLCTCLFTVK
ncbi:uncharacterized protein [Battus philenor]|uniref:uncharacterized protein n=1 Tax=Battus philenor TaxID=42288 RepID=UPI0035D031E0